MASDPQPAGPPAQQSFAERFAGREPRLDVVRLSAPWRPFADREHPRHDAHRSY